MSNRWIFVVSVGCALMIAMGTIFVAPLVHEAEPPTVCKAEACPAAPACPVPVECPPLLPPIMSFKVLSEELNAIIAKCKPAADHALAALQDTTESGYEAMSVARRLGVSALKFEWLENEEARKAATALFYAYAAVNDGLDAAYEAIMACRKPMEDSFHGTEAWLWVDDEETEEPMVYARGFATAMYEFFNQEFMYGAECNAVARRLECPMPKPQAVEAVP